MPRYVSIMSKTALQMSGHQVEASYGGVEPRERLKLKKTYLKNKLKLQKLSCVFFTFALRKGRIDHWKLSYEAGYFEAVLEVSK